MRKTYLRVITWKNISHQQIDIFEGNIKEDKKCWKLQNADVRYFKLEEIK